MNTAMRMMFGQNYMPASDNGQSMYEAMLQRNRSTEFLNLQRSGLMNNGMASRVGLGGNPLLGILGEFATPDSAMARTMSPFMGGNPMAAQMQLYAGLAGAGVMGNFGRMGAVSSGETEEIMQSLEKQFYKRQNYEGPGGVREDLNAQGKEVLRNIAKGPDANKIFRDMGFKGIEADKEGKLNAKGEELIKNFNVVDENDPVAQRIASQTSAKSAQADMLSADLEKALKEGGGKITEDVSEGLLKRVKDVLKISDRELDKFKTEATRGTVGGAQKYLGEVDVDAFRKEMEGLRSGSPLSALQEKGAASQKAGGAVKGFDFEKSRGFKLEDFTSGFIKAADLRMLGDRKGAGMAASMADYVSASGGAMSAARAVFGNKSGAELVSKISNIAGTEVDLGSEKGAGEVEGLLRKVNATARVAGISIKTMLSIIDAGKQLAANHPALQSTSSAAIAELGMKAVGTAASLGATMSAADYRKAGGAQGIASREMKTAQEFAAGPVGATIAAAYYGATDEEKAQLKELLKNKPVTGRSLDEGLRAGMAKIRGMSVGQLYRLSSDNPELLAEAMKDKDTANTVFNAAKPALTSAMFQHLNRVGLSTEQMQEMYKNSKGDFSQVDAKVRRYLVTAQDKRVWEHSKIGVQEMLENGTRTDDEKSAYAKFEALRDESAKDEAEMDKKYGSKYAPIVTQVVDALSSGTTSKDITGALTHIFATSNKNTDNANAALESAQKAGEKMSEVVGKKGLSDETKIKSGGFKDALNEFITARKAAGTASGDTASTENLGTLTIEELLTTSKMGGQMRLKSSEEGLAELEKLEKESTSNKNWNSREYAGSRNRLTTLRAYKKLGVLDDTRALNIAQRGGVNALSGAAMQAAAGANYKKLFEAERTELTDQLGSQLNALEASGKRGGWDAQYLKNYYTSNDGKVDLTKMLKDKNKGEGAFNKDEWGDYWSSSTAAGALNTTQDKINIASQRAGALNETSPELQSRKDLSDAMNKLTETLSSGDVLGGGLTSLITAIQQL